MVSVYIGAIVCSVQGCVHLNSGKTSRAEKRSAIHPDGRVFPHCLILELKVLMLSDKAQGSQGRDMDQVITCHLSDLLDTFA